MQFVMCDVWCVTCEDPDLIFCKMLSLWVNGRNIFFNFKNLRVFTGFPESNPSGSHMYAITCKASYIILFLDPVKEKLIYKPRFP